MSSSISIRLMSNDLLACGCLMRYLPHINLECSDSLKICVYFILQQWGPGQLFLICKLQLKIIAFHKQGGMTWLADRFIDLLAYQLTTKNLKF